MATDIELVLITGRSGAGRSTAAHALEDLGFMVVDNIPPQLIGATVEIVAQEARTKRLAVVADVRGGALFATLAETIEQLRQQVALLTVVFLEASVHALVRRFESSRRPHPIQKDISLLQAIEKEGLLLADIRDQADLIIDTSERNVHDLRRAIDAAFEIGDPRLHVTITSFGFKYGIPVDADMVADVRFLPNPFWQPELRHLTGLDAAVNDYVVAHEDARKFLDAYSGLLQLATDGYLREGKRYLSVAVGCTGGQHRSVAMAENLAARLVREGVECVVSHRDRGRE